jgi:hypothetical protein
MLPDGVDDADHVPASKAIFTLSRAVQIIMRLLSHYCSKRAEIWQQNDNKNESGYLERI